MKKKITTIAQPVDTSLSSPRKRSFWWNCASGILQPIFTLFNGDKPNCDRITVRSQVTYYKEQPSLYIEKVGMGQTHPDFTQETTVSDLCETKRKG